MRFAAFLPLLLLLALAGCGSNSTGGTSNLPPVVSAQDVTGNWQIQSGPSGTTPAAGVLLLGDLVSSDANVTGTFRFSNLVQGNLCGAFNQVITVSGTVDATNPVAQVLKLTSAPFGGSVVTAQLVLPALLRGFGTGTIQVSGTACSFPPGPAIGSEFAPATGTYAGTLTPTSGSGPGATSTLVLAQATTPSADGQFAITGSLALASSACTLTVPVAGTASGVGINLDDVHAPLAPPAVHLLSTQAPLGTTQNLNANLLILSGACLTLAGTPYSGTLVKQ